MSYLESTLIIVAESTVPLVHHTREVTPIGAVSREVP